jgi:hypothetical protein
LLNEREGVKLAKVPTIIADNLNRQVSKRRLSKRADRTAIRAIPHNVPSENEVEER